MNTQSIIQAIKNLIAAFAVKPSMNPQDHLYNVAVSCLGMHCSLNAAVPAEEGCAEALSFALKKAGYTIPPNGIPTVNGIIQWALSSGLFQEINGPEYGCIITAHSPDFNNPDYAHTGITLKHGIASNNSFGGIAGLFTENYTDDSFNHFFRDIHGSDIRYFRPLVNPQA